jgi:dimethyl sulfoxide reductase membrane subunit
MAPLFVASALVSGLALVILLALAVRRTGRLRFPNSLVSYLGGLLAIFIAVEAFFVLSEMLTAAYPGAPFEGDPAMRLLVGPYAPLFWFEMIVGLGLPFVLLAIPRFRADPRIVAVAAVIAIVGIYVHRLNIVLNGLSFSPVGLPPGVSVGVFEPGQGSFAMSHWYVPSLVEWLVGAGIVAFGALAFTIAVRSLPLQEPEDH